MVAFVGHEIQKKGFKTQFLKNVQDLKVQTDYQIYIKYVTPSRGPLLKTLKSWPFDQNCLCPMDHKFKLSFLKKEIFKSLSARNHYAKFSITEMTLGCPLK